MNLQQDCRETEERLCSRCNEVKDVFKFGPPKAPAGNFNSGHRTGITARSWRTLDLLVSEEQGGSYDPGQASRKIWKITKTISKECSFCLFLTDCASRMAFHAGMNSDSGDWVFALETSEVASFVSENARGARWTGGFQLPVLKLKICRSLDNAHRLLGSDPWKYTHLIIPVQTYEDGDDEILDTIDWESIIQWLYTCQSQHDESCNTDSNPLPVLLTHVPGFNVIDCKTEIIIPAEEIQDLEYITLSYVWGGSNSTTTSQAVDARPSVSLLPENSLRPKVVNDAMEVVRRIGHRYLWVDRYCISQSDHSSKLIQIQNMGRIYSTSVLTIIASAGDNADYGLPDVGSGPRLQPLWTSMSDGKIVIPVIHFEPPNNDILNSKWNSRGWTYQEALLSKRRLVFTEVFPFTKTIVETTKMGLQDLWEATIWVLKASAVVRRGCPACSKRCPRILSPLLS